MFKKAASQGFWVVIVMLITIAGLLLLLPLFGKTKVIAEDLTDYRICKDGNRGIVQTRLRLFDWVVAEQGVKHCRTERVKVSAGKEYETLAKKMALCWDQYLEGKEELFETKDNNYCAFCSVLEFEDKNKKLNGLTKYLTETSMLGAGKKYADYLLDVEVKENEKNEFINFDLQNNILVDTSKEQAIMFVMYKDAYPGIIGQARGFTSFIGAGAGSALAIGPAVGAALGLCGSTIVCGINVVLLVGGGGFVGYMIGSDRSADWRARILITEYDNKKLEQLRCTRLEGLDYLKIQKK